MAETSAIDEEIAIRFNNAMIKRVVPIKDEDLDEFKNKYKPKLEKLKLWSDFELMEYIKKSFVSFKR
ncbi:MAG: hypothetical protein EOO85_19550 [Pedobacter sp.]|nr:MAG: hypothetical protein EOO85_19550 [Pedobacter sp.]